MFPAILTKPAKLFPSYLFDMNQTIMFRKEKNFRTFEPPAKPAPRHELEWNALDEQKDCLFITKLPAELRNQVYELVFTTNSGIYNEDAEDAIARVQSTTNEAQSTDTIAAPTSQPQSILQLMGHESVAEYVKRDSFLNNLEISEETKPAHPLSLLLTCRRVYQEAAILAFSTYTFATSSKLHTTFYTLRSSTSVLSTTQFEAISSLAFDLGNDYNSQSRRASDFLSNSLLLFTNAKRLEIRVKRTRVHPNACHGYEPFVGPPDRPAPHWREKSVRKYVPKWFHTTLGDVLDGRSYSWQKGQKWKLEFPQFEYPEFSVQQEYSEVEGWHMCGTMDAEYVGKVEGVEICACGCGEPSWVLAQLVQETGRKVDVEVLFYADSDREREKERKGLTVRLRPGVESLEGVEVVEGGTGVMWGGDETFWERARRKRMSWWTGGHWRRTNRGGNWRV